MGLTRSFVTSVVSANAPGPLEGMPVYSYGHSYQATPKYNTGAGAAGTWVERIVARHHMTWSNRAADGLRMVDAGDCVARRVLNGTHEWALNSRGLVTVCATQNEAAAYTTNAAYLRSYQYGLRAILAATRAKVRVPASGSGWVVSSGWTRSTTLPALGTSRLETTTTGSYAEVKVTGAAADLLLMVRAAGGGTYTIASDGVTVRTVDLSATVGFDYSPTAVSLTGLGSGTHTIRVTLTSGAYLGVEGLFVPSETPPPVVLLGEPTTTASTLNTNMQTLWLPAMQTVAAEFPHAVYVHGSDGWDTATMLSAEGLHPNDKGAGFLATRTLDALDARIDWSNGLNYQGLSPTYAAPAAPTAPTGGGNAALGGTRYSADDANRANGSPGSTPTGSYAWSASTVVGAATPAWSVTSNQIACVAGAATTSILLHDNGQADGIVSARVWAGFSAGLVFRAVDANNYWVVWAPSGGLYRLQSRTSGVTVDVAVSSIVAVPGDTIAVHLSGTSIIATANGVEIGRTTSAVRQTATKHGFEATEASASQFDDFAFAAPGPLSTPVAGVTGLRAWYAADKLTGLADADPTSSWPDSSGLGHNTVSGGVDRPTYKTSQANSLPVLRFDGSNDAMSANEILRGASFSVFAVIRPSQIGTVIGPDAATATPQLYITNSGGLKLQIVSAVTAVVGTGATALSTSAFQVVCATFLSGSSWATYVNGAADGSGSTGVTMSTTSSTLQLVGRRNVFEVFGGDMAEIISYDGVLSGTDRSAVTAYLGTKYGITVV